MEKTDVQIEETLLLGLVEVAKQLSQAIRMRSFYPKGHGAVGSSLEKLKHKLDTILAEHGEITIGSTGDALVFEGIPFGEDKKPVKNLAQYLKVRDMSGVTFRPGVSQSELENAVETLSASPEAFASHESPLLNADLSSERVEFKQIHYDRVIRHVSEEEAESLPQEDMNGVWRSVVLDDLDGRGPGLAERAKSMIAGSVADRVAFKELTSGLVKAGARYEGDRTAFVAKGLAKTCEGLAAMTEEERGDGVHFFSEELQSVDPEVILKLLERQEDEDSTDGQVLLSEVAQSLPTDVKLGILATLIRSQHVDSSRKSSVFSRIAGAEKRRRDLLRAIEDKAHRPGKGEDSFRQLMSAVQELVISETETKFVGSSYVSMLEALGEDTTIPGEDPGGEPEIISELRRSLEPEELTTTRIQFLMDLAGLQENVEKLEMTINDLKSTCEMLSEKTDFEAAANAACEIAGHLTLLGDAQPEIAKALQECLQSLITVDNGRFIIETLARETDGDAGRLRAVLEAEGSHLIGYACEYATHTEDALENKDICDYLAAHGDEAATYCGDRLLESTAPQSIRLLNILSHLDSSQAIEQIEPALRHHERSVQVEAVRTLAHMKSSAANEILHRLLEGRDRRLAIAAANSLGESGSQGAAELLIESVQHLHLFGRRIPEVQQVAKALGRIGAPAAVPHLEAILRRRLFVMSEQKRKLRETVAHALLNNGSEDALSVLERGAACRNRQVREICSGALERHSRAPKATHRKGGDGPGHGDMREQRRADLETE